MTIAAIHQPQYLSYLGFFHKLAHCDIFVAMDNVQFERRGIQHRNKIKTKQGEQWLTVPVTHRSRDEELINEIIISAEQPWVQKQWGSLVTNYSRAPYFDRYAPPLKAILDQGWTSLCELDMALTRWVMDELEIKIPMVYLSTLAVEGRKSELLINACKAVGADTYLSGTGGKRYMDLAAFEAAQVNIQWQEFQFPTYEQLFPEMGFAPYLSIVDTLMCCGPNTRKFLEMD
jgi:hypothetical protein